MDRATDEAPRQHPAGGDANDVIVAQLVDQINAIIIIFNNTAIADATANQALVRAMIEGSDDQSGLPPTMVPRYMAFVFVPPEIVNQNYMFKPMGIFSLENKIVKAAQVMDLIKLFAGNPAFDMVAAGKYVAAKSA